MCVFFRYITVRTGKNRLSNTFLTRREAIYRTGCPIPSISNELQIFSIRNEDVVLRTMKGGVLTLLFTNSMNLNVFQSFSIFTRYLISRSYKWTYSVQNDERRRFNASVVQFHRNWTNFIHFRFEMKILSSKQWKGAF